MIERKTQCARTIEGISWSLTILLKFPSFINSKGYFLGTWRVVSFFQGCLIGTVAKIPLL